MPFVTQHTENLGTYTSILENVPKPVPLGSSDSVSRDLASHEVYELDADETQIHELDVVDTFLASQQTAQLFELNKLREAFLAAHPDPQEHHEEHSEDLAHERAMARLETLLKLQGVILDHSLDFNIVMSPELEQIVANREAQKWVEGIDRGKQGDKYNPWKIVHDETTGRWCGVFHDDS